MRPHSRFNPCVPLKLDPRPKELPSPPLKLLFAVLRKGLDIEAPRPDLSPPTALLPSPIGGPPERPTDPPPNGVRPWLVGWAAGIGPPPKNELAVKTDKEKRNLVITLD